METEKHGTLLLYAPAPLYSQNDTLFAEDQALNGLRLWAKSFERVMVMMPLMKGTPPKGWSSIEISKHLLDRVEIIPMPEAFRPDQFYRQLRATRRRIAGYIAQADYLSFAIGGLFGDWGLVSCSVAVQMNRPHAVWTDSVHSQVVWRTRNEGNWRRRLMARVTYLPMVVYERKAIRQANLGLFHGRDTFETYKQYSVNPQIVHDIHYSAEDHITETALNRKIEGAQSGPLKIVYTGRAEELKGPLDWIEVLENLASDGIDFQATWLGGGSQMSRMKERIARSGLSDRVRTPGFVSDREEVLKAIQEAHIFLFCHKTPESPRCLIEALISGTPLIGYDSVYARDLVDVHQGGKFAKIGEIDKLSSLIKELEIDRTFLADLITKAKLDGEPFDDEAVFIHRSDLIKKHLPVNP